jgi:hypothetical protein
MEDTNITGQDSSSTGVWQDKRVEGRESGRQRSGRTKRWRKQE